MRISIFGMGYVGVVCAGCLAEAGHEITGVDVSPLKVELLRQGKAPVVEPGLEDILSRQVASGRLRATSNTAQAVQDSELSMICVGTPPRKNGALDLRYVRAVCREIGEALRRKSDYHVVVVRSTVIAGTVRGTVIPLLEAASGKRAGVDFGVAINPEFLRESTAIEDYLNPPMTVIGELDARSGEALAQLYADLPGALFRRSIEVAEVVKYACNAWHAAKITFANEIGAFAKGAGVDGRAVMEIVCADKKLNISPYYMRPGFAFGGSCLPKDLRALVYRAQQLDVELPMLSSVMRSNKAQIEKAVELIESFGARRVGLLGLSFKADTDDLRESPLVELAQQLIGKGFELSIYDRNVQYARIHGANRDYINNTIPHVSSLLEADLDQVIDKSEIMVVGNRDAQFADALERVNGSRPTLDLVGFMAGPSKGHTQGICW